MASHWWSVNWFVIASAACCAAGSVQYACRGQWGSAALFATFAISNATIAAIAAGWVR